VTGTLAPVSSSVLVRVVFGLLVLATVGAFFVTQRLKREDPVVKQVELQRWISPNGDGRKDEAVIAFRIPERDEVTVSILDERGDEARRLVDGRRLGRGRHRFTWDGLTDAGQVAPDGEYRLRVTLREEGRSLNHPRPLLLDTKPPRPAFVEVAPPLLPAGAPRRVRLRYRGDSSPPAEFRVYRTDEGPPREVARFSGTRGEQEAVWNGRAGARPAPEGGYAFSVTVRDRAGNAGSAPPRLPPTAATAPEGTGVTVAGPRAAGPLEPVQAGSVVRVALGPGGRRFRWRLSRLGSTRPVREGRGSGARLAFRLPRDVRTGVHLLVIQAAGRRVDLPLAVRGRQARGARVGRGRVLVVLPAITWQGRNAVDDDADGFPDTLDGSQAVSLTRPFARGDVPVGFAGEIAPLMRFLDASRLAYDLTTDLALARRRGPALEDHSGVLFPGTERWLPSEAGVSLRDYVDSGGKVAYFGTEAFRRRVRVQGGRLVEPSAPEQRNVFGESAHTVTSEPAPLVVFTDGLGLFGGSDGFVGLFTQFEQSDGLVEGARVESAAGRVEGSPAFVAYRLAGGVVVRAGTPGWGPALAVRQPSPEIQNATRRIWAFLSR
jgi:hypothetical protein